MKQIEVLAKQFIDALHAVETAVEEPEKVDALDALVTLFSPEARLTNAALRAMNRELERQEAIRSFWVDYCAAIAPGRSEFHQITVSERAAGLFWTTKGTGPKNQSVQYDGATLLEFDDNSLIEYFRGYYDTRELAEQENPRD